MLGPLGEDGTQLGDLHGVVVHPEHAVRGEQADDPSKHLGVGPGSARQLRHSARATQQSRSNVSLRNRVERRRGHEPEQQLAHPKRGKYPCIRDGDRTVDPVSHVVVVLT
jgi:hypothetical protein